MKRISAVFLATIMFVCAMGFASIANADNLDLVKMLNLPTETVGVNETLKASNNVEFRMLGCLESSGIELPAEDKKIYQQYGLGTEWTTPSNGNVYLYAIFELTNNGTAPYKLDIMFDHLFSSVDGADMDYSLDADLAGDIGIKSPYGIDGVSTTEIQPKSSAIVYFPYEIPKGWKQAVIRLRFDTMFEFVLGKADQLSENQLKSIHNSGVANAPATSTSERTEPTETTSSGSGSSGSSAAVTTDLSPNNKCPAQPTVYMSPRWRNKEDNKAYDLSNGFQASQINQNNPKREYGMYFKFTPHATDNGYTINRFDITISTRDGKLLYTVGTDLYMQCETGYYFSWNFLPLEDFFDVIRTSDGKVPGGHFQLDVYFNRLWAGKANFSIK